MLEAGHLIKARGAQLVGLEPAAHRAVSKGNLVRITCPVIGRDHAALTIVPARVRHLNIVALLGAAAKGLEGHRLRFGPDLCERLGRL